MNKLIPLVTLTFASLVAIANTDMRVENMKASVSSASMKALSGEVMFKEVPEGLQVTATVKGLKPNTTHGFHVHEKGECKGPDYKSAGDHFNPESQPHGSPDTKMSHVGDMGNLVSDKNGVAKLTRVVPHTNAESLKQMQGKAVIIHANADDLKSQPAGDAGDRIACGIIKTM